LTRAESSRQDEAAPHYQQGNLSMAEHSEHIAVVTTAPTEMEAGIIVAALEREGIRATMSGAETAGFRVGVPGEVQILVAQKDEAAARQALSEAAAFDDSDEFDEFGDAEE
jgi:hypothetical protein